MAESASPLPNRAGPDILTAAYATGGLPPAIAILLPLLVALCGLAAIALTPRDAGSSAAIAIDPTITGSIAAAPLFEGRGNPGRGYFD